MVYSDLWKSSGWIAIIFVAAIAGIDPALYEAAIVDGANRWRKMWHIVLPGIKSTIMVMFILQVGHIMSAGFQQIFNLYSPPVFPVADILDTYVFRISFQQVPRFGVSTAVSMFAGVVNFVLLLMADRIAKLFGESGVT